MSFLKPMLGKDRFFKIKPAEIIFHISDLLLCRKFYKPTDKKRHFPQPPLLAVSFRLALLIVLICFIKNLQLFLNYFLLYHMFLLFSIGFCKKFIKFLLIDFLIRRSANFSIYAKKTPPIAPEIHKKSKFFSIVKKH